MRFGVVAAAAACVVAAPASAATYVIDFEELALGPVAELRYTFEFDGLQGSQAVFLNGEIVEVNGSKAFRANSADGRANPILLRLIQNTVPGQGRQFAGATLTSADVTLPDGGIVYYGARQESLDPGETFNLSGPPSAGGRGEYRVSYFSGFRDTGYIDNVTITTSLQSVPEPATWALLILGFGAIGGAMRRRHATQLPSVFSAPRVTTPPLV